MTTIARPKTNFSIVGTPAAPEDDPRVLFVGQQLAGTAITGALITEIGTTGQEDALFGNRSVMAGMIRKARAYNTKSRFDAIGLDDAGAATAAAGVITITGTATETETFTVSIGSRTDHKFTVAVTDTDTATVVGDALVSLITADLNAPFTAANVTGVVTITAANGGTVGNDFGIEIVAAVAGITVTLTTPFGSGATDPTLTGVLDVIGDERYQTIVWQFDGNIEIIKDFLDPRFNDADNILDGVAVVSMTDTLANIKTEAGLHNSQSVVLHGNEAVVEPLYDGSAIFEFNYNIAATFGALRALRFTVGADISNIVTARGPLDAFGGPGSAALPYFNTRARFLPLIDVGRGFNETEIGELNDVGAFVIGNNQSRTDVVLGELFTTFKTDTGGNPDESFQFLNTVDELSVARFTFVGTLKATYSQHRLTDGTIVAGRNMVNQVIIEGKLDEIFQTLSGPDFAIAAAGQDAITFFKQNRTVTVDTSTGSVTIFMLLPVVAQLRSITGVIQLQFGLTL